MTKLKLVIEENLFEAHTKKPGPHALAVALTKTPSMTWWVAALHRALIELGWKPPI